jgi:hypothetical protein
VKNQYFGDKRDLFKFSLLERLTQGIQEVDQLTCIWLLTAPSPNNDGNRHFREQAVPTQLAGFLRGCVDAGRRDVREFARYMADRPVRYLSYGDKPTNYFTSETRSTYFAAIPDEGLRRSVVFFDPDNGVEPRSIVSAAHIKLLELRSVFERMDENSIAVVYQHLPRQPALEFWPGAAARVQEALDSPTGFAASGDIGFLIAPRSAAVGVQVAVTIDQLARDWSAPVMAYAPR